MPIISVFYCPKANALVRGSNVKYTVLPNKMVEAIGDCPLHRDEKLRVVHYPDQPFSKVGNETQPDDIPKFMPPVEAGTVERPSSQFTEVFWKTVRMTLPPEQKAQATEIATTLWEEVLSEADKQALLDAFASTGVVPHHHIEVARNAAKARPKPLIAMGQVEQERKNPEPLPLKRDEAIDREIAEHELILTDLLERFEVIDNEAAQPFIFDLAKVAAVVGDTRYLELLVLQNQDQGH